MSSLYRELVEYLAVHSASETLLAFRISDVEQQRADDLTERNKLGQLTSDETRELREMFEFDELLSLLKARALQRQRQPERT